MFKELIFLCLNKTLLKGKYMERTVRIIATMLAIILFATSIPVLSISSATVSSPFDSTILSDSANSIKSVTVSSSESIGSNGEVSLYKATISSSGTRKDALKTLLGIDSRTFEDTFSGVSIATGGRLFVYSKPTDDGQGFSNNLINDIAAQFEAEHPEWRVAVVTNASFFDNEDSKTADMGEPEDIYIEDGKTYKSYIEKGEDGGDVFKIGRGIVGLKADGTVIYNTIENGTSHYTGSTAYEFDSRYTLEVLGEGKSNSIYDYTMRADGMYDSVDLGFLTPDMAAKNLSSATVYKVKCDQFRRAHVGVNGREVGTKTYYFEGEIEAILSGSASMKAPEGYVYVTAYAPLEHLSVGTTVRATQKMTGEWADASYVFGYKQQILHEGTVLFKGSHQESYGDAIHGSYDASWSEDLSYASYGSNRTAVGFKADGTPVIITMPRKIHGTYVENNVTKDIETSATYSEMAWYMKSIGCVNAFMMDCGGSMGMYKKSTDSDTYEVACCEPKHTQPSRPVANALILAYPSGKSAPKEDALLDDATYKTEYITATSNPSWIAGTTKLRSLTTTSEKSYNFYSGTTLNSTISNSTFTVTQSNTTYNFQPGSISSSYEAVYAYTNLGYTVEAGRRYVYCFKLQTENKGKYTSFLFGEYPTNLSSTKKMLNNFAVVGGAFSNNGDSTYSDVRAGVGRVQAGTDDVFGSNQDINLHLESSQNKKYSTYRIDIDGLSYTLKAMKSTGEWVSIGGTYTLPEGTQLIMGCASWTSSLDLRVMSVRDAVCVDITDLSSAIDDTDKLNSLEYTAQSWQALEASRTTAGYSVNRVNQALINNAAQSLKNASAKLVKRIDVASDNIAEYEATSQSAYTKESWAAYTAAYTALIEAINANDLASLDSLNEAYVKARSALTPAEVSVAITWSELDFVYSSGRWNPTTHSYDGDDGYAWNGNGSTIGVENNSASAISVGVAFDAASEFNSVSGSFYVDGTLVNGSFNLPSGESEEISMKLSGSIPSSTADKSIGGRVTVTVSPN